MPETDQRQGPTDQPANNHLLDTVLATEYNDIIRIAAQLCHTPESSIALVDEDHCWYPLVEDDLPEIDPEAHLACAQSIRGGEAVVIPDTHQDERFSQLDVVTHAPYVRFYAGVPLLDPQGQLLGTFSVVDHQPQAFDKHQKLALEALGRQVVSLVESRRHNQLLESRRLEGVEEEESQPAMSDELTQLFSIDYLKEELVDEIQRSRRYQLPLSVLLLDLDHFQMINDQFGYKEGNLVLKLLSRQVVGNTRDTDTVGRYGGDEFVIVLPCTTLDTALQLAERLRQGIEQQAFHNHQLTVSIGVTQLLEEMANPAALFAAAEQALYRAKMSGRNCIKYTL